MGKGLKMLATAKRNKFRRYTFRHIENSSEYSILAKNEDDAWNQLSKLKRYRFEDYQLVYNGK